MEAQSNNGQIFTYFKTMQSLYTILPAYSVSYRNIRTHKCQPQQSDLPFQGSFYTICSPHPWHRFSLCHHDAGLQIFFEPGKNNIYIQYPSSPVRIYTRAGHFIQRLPFMDRSGFHYISALRAGKDHIRRG